MLEGGGTRDGILADEPSRGSPDPEPREAARRKSNRPCFEDDRAKTRTFGTGSEDEIQKAWTDRSSSGRNERRRIHQVEVAERGKSWSL
jgi:hypothetical protein